IRRDHRRYARAGDARRITVQFARDRKPSIRTHHKLAVDLVRSVIAIRFVDGEPGKNSVRTFVGRKNLDITGVGRSGQDVQDLRFYFLNAPDAPISVQSAPVKPKNQFKPEFREYVPAHILVI